MRWARNCKRQFGRSCRSSELKNQRLDIRIVFGSDFCNLLPKLWPKWNKLKLTSGLVFNIFCSCYLLFENSGFNNAESNDLSLFGIFKVEFIRQIAPDRFRLPHPLLFEWSHIRSALVKTRQKLKRSLKIYLNWWC